jgi:digeranylgeranylglycerophospholipid reductase
LVLDVAVIGAGPAGSRTAYRLAALGYRVEVFEKRPAVGEKRCCTGIISQECISRFGITSDVIYRQVNSAKLFSPSGESIHLYRPDTQASVVNRSALDQALAHKAQSLGVNYQLNSKVTNIILNKGGVFLEVEEKGQVRHYEFQAAVLTTGFNAPVVKRLGLGQVGDFVTGVQAEVRGNGIEEIEVYFDQKLAPGFFAWLVPTTEGKCLAGLMSRDSPGLRLRDWLISLEAQYKIIAGDYQIHYAGIPIKPLPRTYIDRLLVIGDAAGQVKPTTGGGIYFGMLGADMAAETLHNAIQEGDLSARRLSGYERDWKNKLGQELGKEYFARQIYRKLNNQQINALFSRAKSSGIVEALLKEDIEFDWHGGLMLKILKAGILSQAKRIFRMPMAKG